jgi:hypothetical protein
MRQVVDRHRSSRPGGAEVSGALDGPSCVATHGAVVAAQRGGGASAAP